MSPFGILLLSTAHAVCMLYAMSLSQQTLDLRAGKSRQSKHNEKEEKELRKQEEKQKKKELKQQQELQEKLEEQKKEEVKQQKELEEKRCRKEMKQQASFLNHRHCHN